MWKACQGNPLLQELSMTQIQHNAQWRVYSSLMFWLSVSSLPVVKKRFLLWDYFRIWSHINKIIWNVLPRHFQNCMLDYNICLLIFSSDWSEGVDLIFYNNWSDKIIGYNSDSVNINALVLICHRFSIVKACSLRLVWWTFLIM